MTSLPAKYLSFIALGAVVISPVLSCVPAFAADYSSEAGNSNRLNLKATISDADLATLAAAGIDVTSVTFDNFLVTVNTERNAQADAAFPSADLIPADAEYGPQIQAQSIGGYYGYDKEALTSPWVAGEGILQQEQEAFTQPSILINVRAHTSFYYGGTTEGQAETWIADNYITDIGTAATNSLAEAGLRGHNAANQSSAVDGSSGIWVQVFAKGFPQPTGQFAHVGQPVSVALTDPIWVAIDTSDFHSFDGSTFTLDNGDTAGINFPLPEADASNWSVVNGKPELSLAEHLGDNAWFGDGTDTLYKTKNSFYTYNGDLEATSATWYDYETMDLSNNFIFTNASRMPDGSLGITASNYEAGILSGSVTDMGDGTYQYSVDTQQTLPMLSSDLFAGSITVLDTQVAGSVLTVTLRANDNSAITLGGDVPFGIGGQWGWIPMTSNYISFGSTFTLSDPEVVISDPPPLVIDPPLVSDPLPPVVEEPPVVTPEPTPEPEVVVPVEPERFIAKTGVDAADVTVTTASIPNPVPSDGVFVGIALGFLTVILLTIRAVVPGFTFGKRGRHQA